jgi:hypothetical protein
MSKISEVRDKSRSIRGISVGVVPIESYVIKEVVDAWEEIVSIHVHIREEDASSHAAALPKNLLASLTYRITRDFGGLLSRPMMRVGRRDGEDMCGDAIDCVGSFSWCATI